mmetsp:Transcript_68098/g.138135  ORF Transcript_68098/g.138135 Transcript_68098/m.138135 type:complete len:686 (-) Transcript_68098:58-2115(-)
MAMFGLLVLAFAVGGNAESDPTKKTAAIEMVFKMMENTANKVTAEGETEFRTYTKFENFCTDTKEEKTAAITENTDKETSLKANIDLWTETNTKDKKAIGDLETEIDELKKKIEDTAETRKEELAEYKKTNGEVEAANVAIAKALEEMKAGRSSFLQKSSITTTVKEAMLLASNLGLKTSKAMTSISGEDSSYEGVVDMLEDLQAEFRKSDKTADMDEAKADTAYKMAQQTMKQNLAAKKKQLNTMKQELGARVKAIGTAKSDLVTTQETLEDDKKYVKETEVLCKEKAATFEQRKAMREEELEAITKATDILKDTLAPGKAMLYEVEAKPHVQGVVDVGSFLQVANQEGVKEAEHLVAAASVQSALLSPERQRLVALLSSGASKLQSRRLANLAQRASEDPLKVIKDLISGLITKLQEQAASSQSKKAYCDKEIGEAEVLRNEASEKVSQLNGDLAANEARNDQLLEEISTLKAALEELAAQKTKADSVRKEEAEESATKVSDAKDAISGIKQATQVLSAFYAKGKEAKVESLAQQTAEDVPDAGFDNGEAYKGAQASSTGILGTLEVIQSGFERAISETQALEEKAIKEHRELTGDIDVSSAEKDKALKVKTQSQIETAEEMSQETSALKKETSTMKSALVELAALEEECGIGASYEQRKAARKEEMKVLKDAISIFNTLIEG